jgi:hypothetical protein
MVDYLRKEQVIQSLSIEILRLSCKKPCSALQEKPPVDKTRFNVGDIVCFADPNVVKKLVSCGPNFDPRYAVFRITSVHNVYLIPTYSMNHFVWNGAELPGYVLASEILRVDVAERLHELTLMREDYCLPPTAYPSAEQSGMTYCNLWGPYCP